MFVNKRRELDSIDRSYVLLNSNIVSTRSALHSTVCVIAKVMLPICLSVCPSVQYRLWVIRLCHATSTRGYECDNIAVVRADLTSLVCSAKYVPARTPNVNNKTIYKAP
jgi:hypothetical protein